MRLASMLDLVFVSMVHVDFNRAVAIFQPTILNKQLNICDFVHFQFVAIPLPDSKDTNFICRDKKPKETTEPFIRRTNEKACQKVSAAHIQFHLCFTT